MNNGYKLNKGGRRRGFTIMEALVSSALIAIGVVAVLQALMGIARNDNQQMESERMQRLAAQKLDELVATGQLVNGEIEGDFADENEPNYTWVASVGATGISNLNSLTIKVSRQTSQRTYSTSLQTLQYVPSETGSTQ